MKSQSVLNDCKSWMTGWYVELRERDDRAELAIEAHMALA